MEDVQGDNDTASTRYTVGTFYDVLGINIPGSSIDWARGTLRIKYPYTIELRGEYDFVLDAESIENVADEAKAATLVIARYAAQRDGQPDKVSADAER